MDILFIAKAKLDNSFVDAKLTITTYGKQTEQRMVEVYWHIFIQIRLQTERSRWSSILRNVYVLRSFLMVVNGLFQDFINQ